MHLAKLLALPVLAAPVLFDAPQNTTFTLNSTSSAQIGKVGTNLGADPPSTFDVTVHTDGNVDLPASGFHINPVQVTAAGFTITVELQPTGDAKGTIDYKTGAVEVDTTVRVVLKGSVLGSGDGCKIEPVDLHLSSATQGGQPYDFKTNTATVVDNSFSVPEADGCGFFTGIVNSQIGLPSDSGNTITLALSASPPIVPPAAATSN
jgi:hypothetical protein